MFCANCKTNLTDGDSFCCECGTPTDGTDTISDTATPRGKQNGGKKRRLRPIVILIAIALAVAAIAACVVAIGPLFTVRISVPQYPELPKDVPNQTPEKLKRAFYEGDIDANEYVRQSLNFLFDADSLDEAFRSDKKGLYGSDGDGFVAPCEISLGRFIEEHYDDIDRDLIAEFVRYTMLENVQIGIPDEPDEPDEPEAASPAPTGMAYWASGHPAPRVMHAADKKDVADHMLDQVLLSKGGHFLVWYTCNGEDAVTHEEAELVGRVLEGSVSLYQDEWGIKHSYSSHGELTDERRLVLNRNDIPVDCVKTAMNVYIFDTGSKAVLAEHVDNTDFVKTFNGLFGLRDFPYIVINRMGFDNSEDLTQLVNHELFHNFQRLYYKEMDASDTYSAPDIIAEAAANLASAMASGTGDSDAYGNDNYLKRWSGMYASNINHEITSITGENPGTTGYALFPYLQAYADNVTLGKTMILMAHLEEKPYQYLFESASKAELNETIAYIATHMLTGFKKTTFDPADGLLPIFAGPDGNGLGNVSLTDQDISPGAIHYKKVAPCSVLEFSSGDESSFSQYMLLGYRKEGTLFAPGGYAVIDTGVESYQVDLALFDMYDEFYFIVTNGNLSEGYSYSLSVSESPTLDSGEYKTGFNNYRVEYTTVMTTNAIFVETTTEIRIQGTVDELHQTEYLEMTMSGMGIGMELSSSKTYTDFNTGISYMTLPSGGDKWYKERGGARLIDLKAIAVRLDADEKVEKSGGDRYRMRFSADELSGLAASSDEVDVSTFRGGIMGDVFVENGYIKRIELDLGNASAPLDTGITMVLEFSDFNEAGDVAIPEAIVDAATDF